MSALLDMLVRSAQAPMPAHDASIVDEVEKSFLDTLAVAHAGRDEPVVRRLAEAQGSGPLSPDQNALSGATAAHALDYDDVQLASLAHASAVIVPSLMAVADGGCAPARIIDGYLAGLRVARLFAAIVGPTHYAAGWHATSTLGPCAAAAAIARMQGFDPGTMTHALALAMCQASGMQASFGSMAKPLQAGMAASAGVRAAAWARHGITGPAEPFGRAGFARLYAGDIDVAGQAARIVAADPSPVAVDVARKAYPCCYGGHRLIAAALDLRARLDGRVPEALTLHAQTGSLQPLTIDHPVNGNEAKFCGSYLVAAAMVDGRVTLGHFTDDSLLRADLRAMRQRVRIAQEGPRAHGISDGVVRAVCTLVGGQTVSSADIHHFPGSPESPLDGAELNAKLLDCVGGSHEALAALRRKVRERLRGHHIEEHTT